MTIPTGKQLTLYANLMEEIKVRFDVINHAAQGRTGLNAPFVREFLHLQMRFLCELIALACLVAHGDITFLQSHKIGRSYSAEDILDRMSKLRPHFYPVPVTRVVNTLADGRKHHQLTGIDPSPLSKEHLLDVYANTHKHLHRGSLKKLLSTDTPLDMTINVPEIVGSAQKMSNLLGHHVIPISEELIILCMLVNTDNNNKVQVITAQRTELTPSLIPLVSPKR